MAKRTEDVELTEGAGPSETPVEAPPAVEQASEPLRTSVIVRVVEARGGSALVEWVEAGEVHRGYLPAAAVSPAGEVDPAELERAVPYGLAWEELPITRGDLAAAVARDLRNAGIWTRQDLERRPMVALGALQKALGVHMGALNEFARKEG